MNRLQDTGEKIVIVIDPGHGGENLGTTENGFEEKSMNMITASAMYEELCQYDNIEVYMTRTDDVDLSLKERAEFAAGVDADFMISLHYNASECHELFGSEIWVQMDAPNNVYGYQFGKIWLEALGDRGLFVRGIKTREGKNGDYYGILREAAKLDVPTVIIEHCHVDESRDVIYCDSDEDLILFGKEDATAVAKYFGLKSSTLNVDYSDFVLEKVNPSVPVPITVEDTSAPEVCSIEFLSADYETGQLSFTVSATDYDSPLFNYSYSLDGGLTFGERAVWPGVNTLTGDFTDTFVLNLTIPDGVRPDVVFRAFNMFGLYTDSPVYSSPQTFMRPGKEQEENNGDITPGTPDTTGSSELSDSVVMVPADALNVAEKKGFSFFTFLCISLIVVVIIFVILLISQYKTKRNNRRRDRF